MTHRIVIETHRVPDGYYVARVVKGPGWSRGWTADADDTHHAAFLLLSTDLEGMRPRDTFEFIYVEGDKRTMVDESLRDEIASLRDTRSTHLSILSRTQGKRDGWFAALTELRKMAADAFMRDDDRTAEQLRGIARKLGTPNPPHPYLSALDEQERDSMERIETAKTRLAEIAPEEE